MDIYAFVLVSIGIICVPGPTVIALVSTSIHHGKARGLQAVAGSSSAMFFQLIVAALSTSWLVNATAAGFVVLKWCGVSYLVYLGVQQLLSIREKNKQVLSGSGSFRRGFLVSLTNPKTILFFSAFLPQFTNNTLSYLPQIAMLSLIFWCLAVVLDTTYVLLASKASPMLKKNTNFNYQNAVSGALYLGAGAVLATTNKS